MFRTVRVKPIRIFLLCALLGAAAVFARTEPLFAAGTVGNGTSSSCTEAAFDAALSGGGKIKFNCGAGVKTITLTSTKTIAVTTTIDGSNLIVLSAPGHMHFYVNSSVTLTLKNMTLKDGTGANAGALENYGTVYLYSDKFLNNSSSTHGGAVTNHGTLNVTQTTFKGNKASTNGGAIYIEGGQAAIYVSTFTNNQATSAGGGLASNLSYTVMGYSTFKNNSATDGGAVYESDNGTNDQGLVAFLTTFTNNHGGYGGGVENNGTATLGGDTFNKNHVTGDGGAVWNLTGSLDLEDSAIDQNSAGTTGGGVSVYGDSADIERVSFTNNHADQQGGGIYTTSTVKLFNSTFSGNSSSASGGGVYTSDGTLTAYNNTLANNSAPAGGGIEGAGGTLDVEDNVLSNNSGGDCGGTVPSNGANVASDTTCTNFTQLGDMQHTNALLSPAAKNGGEGVTFLPQHSSPLIDAGSTLTDINVDARYISRPVGSAPDIGAVEVCTQKPNSFQLEAPSNGDSVSVGPMVFYWFRPASCGAFYQLTVRSGSKQGAAVIQQSYVGVPGYVFKKSLPAGVTYYWQVKACNEVGCTGSKWWHFNVNNKGLLDAEPNMSEMAGRLLQVLGHK